VEIVSIPREIDPNGPFSWLLWDGRWGERQPWEFNGPRGPSGAKWFRPVTWVESIRSFSFALPQSETIGPTPTRLFCSVTELGGIALARLPGLNREIAALLVALVATPFVIAAFALRYVKFATAMYFRNLHVFLVVSAAVLVVARLSAWVEQAFREFRLGAELVDWAEEPSFVRWVIGIGLGGFQQLMLALIVAPAIIQATYDLTRRERPGWRPTWKIGLQRLPSTFGAVLLTVGILATLTLSIVLIPLAVLLGVRWLFVAQAVILDGEGAWNARRRSGMVVQGHWFRALGYALLAFFLSGLAGPLAAMLLLVATSITMHTAELISGAIYAVAYPIAIIAATLFYLNRRGAYDTQQVPATTVVPVEPASASA
jgi:hypothetical protein